MQVARAAFSETGFVSSTGRSPVMRKGGFRVTNRTVQGYPPVLSPHVRCPTSMCSTPEAGVGGAAAGHACRFAGIHAGEGSDGAPGGVVGIVWRSLPRVGIAGLVGLVVFDLFPLARVAAVVRAILREFGMMFAAEY